MHNTEVGLALGPSGLCTGSLKASFSREVSRILPHLGVLEVEVEADERAGRRQYRLWLRRIAQVPHIAVRRRSLRLELQHRVRHRHLSHY